MIEQEVCYAVVAQSRALSCAEENKYSKIFNWDWRNAQSL